MRAASLRSTVNRALGLAIVLTCSCSPQPPVIDRDGVGSELGGICAALKDAGCPEGQPLANGRTCFEHLASLSGEVIIPGACASVRGAEAIRRCGDRRTTLTFRCAIDGGM